MGMVTIIVMWPGPFEQTFIPLSDGGAICNFASIGLAVSKKKKFENIEPEFPWTKVNKWPFLLI